VQDGNKLTAPEPSMGRRIDPLLHAIIRQYVIQIGVDLGWHGEVIVAAVVVRDKLGRNAADQRKYNVVVCAGAGV
jgi:hypothetical protein